MRLRISVEIDGVFYESLNYARRSLGYGTETIKHRCLSNDWENYKIIILDPNKKRCTECGEVKLLKEFGKHSASRDGLKSKCKECISKWGVGYYKKNKAKINKQNNKWKKDNPEKSSYHGREWLKRNPAYTNEYKKRKRKENPTIRLIENIGIAIQKSLKGKKNGAHMKDLVDWTVEEGRAHLESLFTEGMSWDNYGYGKYKWNLDHIVAICHWNITSTECQAFRNCWSLDNLQPLWQVRNFEKGNKPMEPKYLIKPDWIK